MDYVDPARNETIQQGRLESFHVLDIKNGLSTTPRSSASYIDEMIDQSTLMWLVVFGYRVFKGNKACDHSTPKAVQSRLIGIPIPGAKTAGFLGLSTQTGLLKMQKIDQDRILQNKKTDSQQEKATPQDFLNQLSSISGILVPCLGSILVPQESSQRGGCMAMASRIVKEFVSR